MKKPGGLPIIAILPASLCRCTVRILFLCFPFGKYPFTVFTFVVLLNYRKQTPCQRFKDVFRNFGCIHAVWDIRFFLRSHGTSFIASVARISPFWRCCKEKIFPCVFAPIVGRKMPCFRPLSGQYWAAFLRLNQLRIRGIIQRNQCGFSKPLFLSADQTAELKLMKYPRRTL